LLMRGGLGAANKKAKFGHMFSAHAAVNVLSVARFFLFGARDVWFVVALPVYLSSVLGWKFWQAGGFMALWVIGYGFVQAAAPRFVRRKREGSATEPGGRSAAGLAFALCLIPAAIAAALWWNVEPEWAVPVGLIVFGIVFALNSAVHSFLILAFTDHDKVAMNVGIYYMANACGRLAGTILSGWLYQVGMQHSSHGGLTLCLLTSTGFVVAAGALSLALPHGTSPRRRAAD
jgi:hypothetical protein